MFEIEGIRVEFDPEVFTSGKIKINVPKITQVKGQCPAGYRLVCKNGFLFCKLIEGSENIAEDMHFNN